MSKYDKAKQHAREEAIAWQSEFEQHNYSWEELAMWYAYFEYKAKRYGLKREFKVNGII